MCLRDVCFCSVLCHDMSRSKWITRHSARRQHHRYRMSHVQHTVCSILCDHMCKIMVIVHTPLCIYINIHLLIPRPIVLESSQNDSEFGCSRFGLSGSQFRAMFRFRFRFRFQFWFGFKLCSRNSFRTAARAEQGLQEPNIPL